MPVEGPLLDDLAKQAVEWYQKGVVQLMEALESDGHPYGAVRKSPAEQLNEYLSLDNAGWANLFSKLERRFRGLPNSRDLVQREAARYVNRMETLRSKLGMPGR